MSTTQEIITIKKQIYNQEQTVEERKVQLQKELNILNAMKAKLLILEKELRMGHLQN